MQKPAAGHVREARLHKLRANLVACAGPALVEPRAVDAKPMMRDEEVEEPMHLPCRLEPVS